jgi:hypothetical protein
MVPANNVDFGKKKVPHARVAETGDSRKSILIYLLVVSFSGSRPHVGSVGINMYDRRKPIFACIKTRIRSFRGIGHCSFSPLDTPVCGVSDRSKVAETLQQSNTMNDRNLSSN